MVRAVGVAGTVVAVVATLISPATESPNRESLVGLDRLHEGARGDVDLVDVTRGGVAVQNEVPLGSTLRAKSWPLQLGKLEQE